VFFFWVTGIRYVWQGNKGVITTFGKYVKTVDPGPRWVFWITTQMRQVDCREHVCKLKDAGLDESNEWIVRTSDNQKFHLFPVLTYKVVNAADALFKVSFYELTLMKMLTKIMQEVGKKSTLLELYSDVDKFSSAIETALKQQVAQWGIEVIEVSFTSTFLEKNVHDAYDKKLTAQLEAEAKTIRANGEIEWAEKLVEASKKLEASPSAMQLRFLDTLRELPANTVIALPYETIKAIKASLGDGEKAA
jgi:regulator of protease activity HflC (stomatin/prohibitin superfamily)